MSTKTNKRKRASAPPDVVVAPVVDPAPAVSAAPSSATLQERQPTVGLSSNCTVKDAAALKNELLQWLDEPASVAIDAKTVERIDTAIMQLLCAFVRDRAERNLGVTWSGTPQPLLHAARLLGVRTLLALPTEAAP